MGSVYHKTVTKSLPKGAEVFTVGNEPFARWKNRRGKTQTAPVNAAGRIVITTGTYMARYRDAEGQLREVATGCRDEMAARRKLSDLERRAELVKTGVLTAAEDAVAEHQGAPLTEHIDAYGTYLESKGVTPKHRKSTLQFIRVLAAACSFKRLSDMNRTALDAWLAEKSRLKNGKATMGARNRNAHIKAIVGFANWCANPMVKRLVASPFDGVDLANEKSDPRRKRRSITEAELIKLLEVAALRPLREAMTIRRGEKKGQQAANVGEETRARLERLGRERALIYKTLVLTGLRRNELASLTIGQLHLDASLPYAELHAADEKNREGSAIPIRVDLAADLAQWITGLPDQSSGAKLFTVPGGLVKLLDRDLELAGIAKRRAGPHARRPRPSPVIRHVTQCRRRCPADRAGGHAALAYRPDHERLHRR